MAEITFDDVSKAYTPGQLAVRGLDMEIADGEFMVLVGPSGCGKTTALRMVAGLEEITSGQISIGGRVVNDTPPKDRDIAMVFQNYALYPHMSVYDNMAFGLKLAKMPRGEIATRVNDAADILGLQDFLDRKPKALSGGQRQRVAMGRAIVRHPQAFLMDEPLSNLDAKLRVQMRAEIARIQRNLGVTTMYVTHDQTEAMTMGDRVAVMRKGELQQVDEPQRLYDNPVNVFVAGFIGSPAMNLLDATVVDTGSGLAVRFAEFELAIPDDVIARRPALRGYGGRRVVLGLRPENLEDAALVPDSPSVRRIRVTPELRESLGSDVVIHFPVDTKPVMTEDTKDLVDDAGGGAEVERLEQAGTTHFMARLDPRTTAAPGQPIELAADTDRLHFFDPETNRAIHE